MIAIVRLPMLLATPQKRSKLTEMRWMNGKTGYLASWLAGWLAGWVSYIAGLAGLVDTQSSSSGLHLKID